MIFTSGTEILLDNFKNIFRNSISSGGLSRDYYCRGGIQEIHDFRCFLRISQVFSISSWNLFGSKILLSTCVKHQKFDYGCSSYPENEAKKSRVWPFFDSKILPSSCDKYQKFDYGCSSYHGNEAQSPDFGHFLTIWGIFRAVFLGMSL